MSGSSGDVPTGGAPGGAAAPPVCPRHPTREAYVRCQRCDRPVCPECQRPAAVGVQCVDCVREGARSARTARTALGGRAGDSSPVVTRSLIALNVVGFALEWIGGDAFTNALLFVPHDALARPWTFLSSAFLHSTTFPLHILLNMYALWIVGPYLEILLGRLRFALLYLLSAFGGSVAYFAMASPSVAPGSVWFSGALGSSGAVFGLFAAFFVVNRRLGRDSRGIAVVIGLNLVIGFVVSGIAWQAHLGGLVVGAVTAAGLAYPPRERRAAVQPVVLAAVAVLLVAVVLVKAATVPAGLLT
jgi:membrane associated rhomboid family serine protease